VTPRPRAIADALATSLADAAWTDGSRRVTAAAAVLGAGGIIAAGPSDHARPIASVTKLLSAYAVLVAVEEGSVALDQPAGPPGATVAHLLAHASGMAPDTLEVVAPPGRRRIYSTAAFAVLADVVAEATGMAFSGYVHDAVVAPLAMSATDVSGHPGAGARSSVDDLARLASELLEPTLIDRVTLAAATRPWFPDLAGVLPGFGRHDPNPWGLGFEVRRVKHPHWTPNGASPATFGHFGRSGSLLWIDPVARLGLVSLSDAPFGPWAAAAWPALGDAVLVAAAG
jgi:CubicO group peptidase (beta-lactamase class C family)